ncbi:sugar phosphate nucleotidyltransferase [Desulfobacterium sp. N47]|uniref:Bifunctional protein glmU n=1 Tax=uncultured Desulfobacterium sp. TaxID=201089 RepID=E1YDD3_9BACT|nr:Bifunctional protein glmU [uncultured Desulfobacterium sp.]
MVKTDNKLVAVILAAGLGKRMKSDKAKVLHEINGKPMIMYVLETAKKIAGNNIVVVVGNQAEKVSEVISKDYSVAFALQKEQLGTGHAVKCALSLLPQYSKQVLIFCGDVSLLSFDTVKKLYDDHLESDRDVSVLAVKINNPKGYGRIIMDEKNCVSGIIEEADADDKQKRINIINSGVYCIKKEFLEYSLNKIEANNAQGEFYLTDVVKIGYSENKNVGAMIGQDSEEILGVNSMEELMTVENILKKRMIL